jgi:hypothetical protein
VEGGISIFRGQDADTRPIGLSWTTDIEVAAGFARGHRGLLSANPVVYEAYANAQKIAFASDERKESEIVLLRSPRHFWVHDEWLPWP